MNLRDQVRRQQATAEFNRGTVQLRKRSGSDATRWFSETTQAMGGVKGGRRRALTLGADAAFDKSTEVDSLLDFLERLSPPS